jgi:hypothetical protein
MRKTLLGAVLLAGMACGVYGQEQSTVSANLGDVAAPATTSPASNLGNFSLGNVAMDTSAGASAMPGDPAEPKYGVFGQRDDYRWQLGVGLEYMRFQSKAFNANLVGLNTSVSYYTNTWFALEGDFLSGFGSDVYAPNSRAKIFGGTGGIRIGERRARWEPFGHALVGGSHLQPQTPYGGRTSLLVQAGAGVDYRVHARLSLRGEGDWVYTRYFSQTQNSFQAVGGIVLHF